ncbi:MAG: HD domain-containing protein [Candidatus Gastranaerophilales bacterium]|nr:HD domain-containing protein [Candidatus Gastranaerophilales bacterium]
MTENLSQFIKSKIENDEFITLIKPFVKDIDCYLVGGYLRDLLCGQSSCDRDLIVKTDIAESLARKIADKTDSHFVVLDEQNRIYRVVMSDKTNYFDISAMLEDDFEKDIKRRDLTINALAFDLNKSELVDLYNGLSDFQNGILQTPDIKNFSDDPLRMLRAYRFCAKYNFAVSNEIENFIKHNKSLIGKIAKERINTELMKLFEGRYSDIALKKADNTGLLSEILPVVDEIRKIPPNTHHHLNLLEHSIETVRQIQRNYENSEEKVQKLLQNTELGTYPRIAFLKLAGFMHDIGKPETWTIEEETGRHRFIMHDEVGSKKAVPILQNLKFSKKQINYIQKMIKFHIYPSSLVWSEEVGSKARLKFYRKTYPYFADLITLAQSDRLSAMGHKVTVDMIVKNLSDLSVLLEECLNFDEAEADPKPLLDGKEIMKITKLPQSKELGDFVKSLYSAQLEGNVKTKEDAVKFIENMLKEK